MQTLSISDGTTTINLISSSTLYLAAAGWPIRIAPPIISDLGGRGPYDDVTEDLVVTAQGSNALPDLREIIRLLDQARRWARGEDVACVKLRVRIDNSTLSAGVVLEAALLGPEGGGVAPANDWSDLLIINEISTVNLTMRRRGLWISSASPTTATASNVSSGTTTAFTLASHHTVSPVEVSLVPTIGPEPRVRGMLFMHQLTTDLRSFEASNMTAITTDDGAFSTDDTSIYGALPAGMGMGTLPPGTYAFADALTINYLRYTQSSATVAGDMAQYYFSTSLPGNCDIYLTIATSLVSTSTEPWVLQITMSGPNYTQWRVVGPSIPVSIISPSTEQVYVVHMGYFPSTGGFDYLDLTISRGTSPVGELIDIAQLWAFYPKQYNTAIYLDAGMPGYSDRAAVVYHRPTVTPSPTVDVRTTTDTLDFPASRSYGDLAIHQAPNTGTIYGTFLSSSIQYLAVKQNWSVRRRRGYVLPE